MKDFAKLVEYWNMGNTMSILKYRRISHVPSGTDNPQLAKSFKKVCGANESFSDRFIALCKIEDLFEEDWRRYGARIQIFLRGRNMFGGMNFKDTNFGSFETATSCGLAAELKYGSDCCTYAPMSLIG